MDEELAWLTIFWFDGRMFSAGDAGTGGGAFAEMRGAEPERAAMVARNSGQAS